MMKEMDQRVNGLEDKLSNSITECQQAHMNHSLKQKQVKQTLTDRKCLLDFLSPADDDVLAAHKNQID
jgi:hypothetical protein